MKKQLLKLGVFTFTIILFLTACGSNEKSSRIKINDDVFTISIMTNLLTPEAPTDYLLKVLEETTEIKLDINWVPDRNYSEQVNRIFATDCMPHVIKVNHSMYNQFKDGIRNGYFWEIEPYLEQFENLRKLKPEILDKTRVNGKLYALYQGRPLSRQGIIYRKDWAEHLGLEAPTTTEEFYEMVSAFTKDDPNQTGQNDTIGLSDRSDLTFGSFKTISSWFGTPNKWGIKNGEIVPDFMFEEYVEAMDFMRKIYSNGYMNLDFPITSIDAQQELFKNGTAGVYVGAMVNVQSFYNDVNQQNTEIVFDVQNRISGPSGQFTTWAIPGYGSLFLFPKSATKTEEELLKVLSFFDHLMEPATINLLMYGIEGEHYTIVDDNLQMIKENKHKYEKEVKPYSSLEIGEPETNGRYVPKATYEAKAKADLLVKDNENFLVHDPTIALESMTYVLHGDRLQQLIDDATYNYILGIIDVNGFKEVVEQWKNEGGHNIIQEFTEAYQASQ